MADPFDPDTMGETAAFMAEHGLEESFDGLRKEVISSKVKEQSILAQSMMNGGPSSVQMAIKVKLDQHKIGMRELAVRTGIKRKRLVGMIEGTIAMPPEDLAKITTAIYNRQRKEKKVMYG